MKAIVQDTYGPPDVLEFRDIEKPEITDDEVLVRVRAAGVDRGVWHLMTGLPYLTRLAFGLRAPKNPVLGMDVAGVAEAVGRDVTRFRPGDEVFGIGKGTFAEYALVREEKLAPKPANLAFEQAAVLAISGLTALQGLRDHGKVEAGQEVLVIGASGGVGTYAVQIAKAFGAQVTGVCSSLEHFYSSGERRRIGSKSFKRSCTWQLKLAHGRSNDRKGNGVKVDSVIYTIVCTANGRHYVGSALSFGVRERIHLSDLNLARHHSRHLQRAWDKYGAEAFRFDILERVGDPSQLTAREQHYLDLLRPAFNALAVAGSSLGFRHTPTSLAKMRAWKRKVPGPMKGRKQTREARAKMSAAKKGHTLKVGTRHAEESKRKMSASQLFITQHNSRPVEQLAPDGAPVRRFRSIAEAARATGAHVGSIRYVLAGRARLAVGHGWRDATEPEQPPDARRTTRADFPWHERPEKRRGIMLPGLRRVRGGKVLSQSELCALSGIRAPAISAYELGHAGAAPRTILRLAGALDVTARALVDVRTVPPNSSLLPHLDPPEHSAAPPKPPQPKRTQRIATNVVRSRRRLGLSQKDLAAQAFVAITTLRDLEHGRRKTHPSTLRKVAAALHTDVRTLAAHPSEPGP